MRLPSRFVITALRQTFSAGILEAYFGSNEEKKQSVADRWSHLPRIVFLGTWLAVQNVSLEFLPERFNKGVADECGYKSDDKIGHRKYIPDGPNQALALTHTRAFKFPH